MVTVQCSYCKQHGTNSVLVKRSVSKDYAEHLKETSGLPKGTPNGDLYTYAYCPHCGTYYPVEVLN